MKNVVAIVDDDSNIRNLLYNYLKDNKFTIIGEKSGIGLIDLFKNYKGHIDILVLDVVIPNLHKLKNFFQDIVDFDIHVVIITGYNFNENLIRELQIVSINKTFILLRKPFSKQAFLEALYKKDKEV